jgi:hypothetical protein
MSNRLSKIMKRASIVWSHPDDFDFFSFSKEEVSVEYTPYADQVLVVSYILWGVTARGIRKKVCKYEDEELKEDYKRRTGSLPERKHADNSDRIQG